MKLLKRMEQRHLILEAAARITELNKRIHGEWCGGGYEDCDDHDDDKRVSAQLRDLADRDLRCCRRARCARFFAPTRRDKVFCSSRCQNTDFIAKRRKSTA